MKFYIFTYNRLPGKPGSLPLAGDELLVTTADTVVEQVDQSLSDKATVQVSDIERISFHSLVLPLQRLLNEGELLCSKHFLRKICFLFMNM